MSVSDMGEWIQALLERHRGDLTPRDVVLCDIHRDNGDLWMLALDLTQILLENRALSSEELHTVLEFAEAGLYWDFSDGIAASARELLQPAS